MTTAAAAPDGSQNWSFPPSPHRHRPLLPCRRLNTSYANCLHILRASTCHHPQDFRYCYHRAVVIHTPPRRGSSMTLKGHWLMTMEHRTAENNDDNNDCVLLLPLPSPSLAHLVATVLLVQTLPDTPLPSPPLSSSHCLLPAFFIVECLHHRSITSSPCRPLLAFTSLPSMVGCYVHAQLALCSPPPAFIIASVDAFVDGRCPLLPIAIHCPLALITSCCLSLLLFCQWFVVSSLPASSSSICSVLCCPIPSSHAVVQASTLSLLAAAPFRDPSPATDACLCRSPVNGWLLRPPPSIILHPLLSLSARAIIDACVANTE